VTEYLKDFKELYEFLLKTSSELKTQGATELAGIVEVASSFASGVRIGLTTEFVGESRIALSRVLKGGADLLSPQKRSDIDDVLHQLTASLNRWPVQPPEGHA
jgi:hypothetical protein